MALGTTGAVHGRPCMGLPPASSQPSIATLQVAPKQFPWEARSAICGKWEGIHAMPVNSAELKLAIAGLGTIGLAVARRVDAGAIPGLRLQAAAARDNEKARTATA